MRDVKKNKIYAIIILSLFILGCTADYTITQANTAKPEKKLKSTVAVKEEKKTPEVKKSDAQVQEETKEVTTTAVRKSEKKKSVKTVKKSTSKKSKNTSNNKPAAKPNNKPNKPNKPSTPNKPKEKQKVWVVDKAAWDERVPEYYDQVYWEGYQCYDGTYFDNMPTDEDMAAHGGGFGVAQKTRKALAGYEVVHHPEQGHWEYR